MALGEMVQLRWVPSHLKVPGNDGADELAMQGRLLHPNNLLPLSKRGRVLEWDKLGLVPMPTPEASDMGSGADSGGELEVGREACPSDGVAYSTDVTETRLRMHLDYDSEEFSTDVSDSRRKRFGGGEARCQGRGG